MDSLTPELQQLHDKIRKLEAQLADCMAQNAELTQDKQRLKQTLKLTEEKLNATLDGNGLCLWEQDIPSGNLIMYNQEWGALLGYTLEERPAHIDSWKSHLHPDDKDWVIKAFYDHVEGKEDIYRAVHRMIHKDGSVSWVSDRGRIIEYNEDGKPKRIMGTHTDITQEKRYEQELARLAHYDPLTNLLNRNALKSHYQKNFKHPQAKGTLIFIDLDGFKGINDKAGHRIGDLLLIHVANTISQTAKTLLGTGQHAIARIGGDEFVILTTAHQAEILAPFTQTLLQQFNQPTSIEQHKTQIGLSIGVCTFSAPTTFAHAYEQADKAMYQVKQQGKHDVAFVSLL
ncbi:sensor domain-containing diguanylate cyclase [Shewanella aestuarii]|uniref:Sensor domain-containing diguanylate cyclase n=1 Tax=Shewanella aestuarii TaxID=1028752 RepID=A0A6G9QPR2_9GAMM|nr:sensor domain-containing diguanylate cyclase [Shewanella aestuarii]